MKESTLHRLSLSLPLLVPLLVTPLNGAWLSVESADLRRAWEVWTGPSYEQLRLSGVLANMLPGWEGETHLKPIEAGVMNLEHTPYAVESTDDFMRRVIHEEWPHEFVLAAIEPFEATWK